MLDEFEKLTEGQNLNSGTRWSQTQVVLDETEEAAIEIGPQALINKMVFIPRPKEAMALS